VVQPGRGFGLTLEAADALGVEGRLGRQDLEGDVPAERFVDGLVDDAHAAAADLAEQAVLAEPLADGRR
jgi:hypothetical protein